jgi:hypothetical protein
MKEKYEVPLFLFILFGIPILVGLILTFIFPVSTFCNEETGIIAPFYIRWILFSSFSFFGLLIIGMIGMFDAM